MKNSKCGYEKIKSGGLVDAAVSKPACRQAGLPFARMCWFDSSLGHFLNPTIFVGFFFGFYDVGGVKHYALVISFVAMFFVYCLSSLSRSYLYVGLTENLERRFNEHQLGKNRTTKPYRPFEIILSEKFETRKEARKKEKYLKSGVGKEFLKAIMKK